MQTPDGRECHFYYEDFHRGRNVQECRIPKVEGSAPWQPPLCAKCPVPAILQANSSTYLQLKLHIKPGFLGFGRKMIAVASCTKHQIPIENPYTGCPQCNAERPGLSIFAQALEDLDD